MEKICINTFALPAIPFGETFAPVVSLIRHDFHIKMGIPSSEEEESMCDVIIRKKYSMEILDNTIYIVNNGNLRSAVRLENVFLRYRRYSPKSGILYSEIPILRDVNAIKIVSYQVLRHIYKEIVGSELPEETNPVSKELVDFVIATRWVTPQIFVGWNADEELKKILPFYFWIAK